MGEGNCILSTSRKIVGETAFGRKKTKYRGHLKTIVFSSQNFHGNLVRSELWLLDIKIEMLHPQSLT